MRRLLYPWMGIACLGLGACGDGGGGQEGGADAAVVPDSGGGAVDAVDEIDAALPDAAPRDALGCVAPAFGEIGGPCTGDVDCGGGRWCLDETENDDGPFQWPASGYCTLMCSDHAECGEGNACSDDLFGGEGPGSVRLCVPECCDGDVCGDGFVCTDTISGFFALGMNACMPGNAAATDGDPCAGVADCNASSLCHNNPFSAPGGVCMTIGCTVGDDSTCSQGGDGRCVDFGHMTACLDACTLPGDCRDDEGYACAHAGPPLGSFCRYPSSDAGDDCEVDTDCGPAGSPWVCLTGAEFPDGYCSGTACDPANPDTCPDDSICVVPGDPQPSYCVAECNPAGSDCRSGYACADLGDGEFGCVVAE